MSFLVTAALAVALFVVLPAAAHLLRRGRAAELTLAWSTNYEAFDAVILS